jgi:hypothetical protein
MTRLEDLQPTAAVRGVLPELIGITVNMPWFCAGAPKLACKASSGCLQENER